MCCFPFSQSHKLQIYLSFNFNVFPLAVKFHLLFVSLSVLLQPETENQLQRARKADTEAFRFAELQLLALCEYRLNKRTDVFQILLSLSIRTVTIEYVEIVLVYLTDTELGPSNLYLMYLFFQKFILLNPNRYESILLIR